MEVIVFEFKVVSISEASEYGAFKGMHTITAKTFAAQQETYPEKTVKSVTDAMITFHTKNPQDFPINSGFELRFA